MEDFSTVSSGTNNNNNRRNSLLQGTVVDTNDDDDSENVIALSETKEMGQQQQSSLLPFELQRNRNIREMAKREIHVYASIMLEHVAQSLPLTSYEIQVITKSVQNLLVADVAGTTGNTNSVSDTNRTMIEVLTETILPQYAHLSHKDWTRTGDNAAIWHRYLFPTTTTPKSTPTTQQQRHMFERIYREGNWDGAVAHSHQQKQRQLLHETVHDNDNNSNNNVPPPPPPPPPVIQKPWAVLVTGVNGIRKTTSIYQEWFPLLLQEAIQSPPNDKSNHVNYEQTLELSNLPCGSNTFFRQLDHIIATLCNEEFIRLYTFTRDMLLPVDVVDSDVSDTKQPKPPASDIIQLYSNMKAAIFSRYRTISELLGVILLREAQQIPINCMVETSGRDVAMFHYIDHFFPAETYNKLALHFTINDLRYAKTSVDQRMIDEMQSGIVALRTNNIFDIINTNVGGPYGSEVLSDIQADSDRVWKEMVMVDDNKGNGVGQDWYKATIQINAHPTEPWTAQAVKPDGSLGAIYPFQRKETNSF